MATAGPETLVAERVRDAIMGGDLVPGQRLVEADLMAQYAVPRAAVRTALGTLAVEGLVEREPNRGARVRAVGIDEVIEIVELRLGIEPLIARRAAERLDDTGAERLAEVRSGLERSLAEGDLLAYSQTSRELDRLLREQSGHLTGARVLGRLLAQAARFHLHLALKPGRVKRSGPEHFAIIDAVLAGDGGEAEAATRRHLTGILDDLEELRDGQAGAHRTDGADEAPDAADAADAAAKTQTHEAEGATAA